MEQVYRYSFSARQGELCLPSTGTVFELARAVLELLDRRAEAGLRVELPIYENLLVRIRGYEHTQSNQNALRMFKEKPELQLITLSEDENSRGLSLYNTRLCDMFACVGERAVLLLPSALPVALCLEAIQPDEMKADG